jgi:hypothetical protein
MTLEQADGLFRDYHNLLGSAHTRGGRRSPSLLPAPKDSILVAIRMIVARLYYLGEDNEHTLRPFFEAAMFIDSFSDTPFDSLEFLTMMQKRRREIVEFYQEILGLPRHDRFYWQRVYALAGVGTETKHTTFFEHIKDRLGRVARPSGSTVGSDG